MHVLVSDPSVSTEQARRVGVTLLSIQEVREQPDGVRLYALLIDGPNGPHRLLGAPQLTLLKPDAYFATSAWPAGARKAKRTSRWTPTGTALARSHSCHHVKGNTTV